MNLDTRSKNIGSSETKMLFLQKIPDDHLDQKDSAVSFPFQQQTSIVPIGIPSPWTPYPLNKCIKNPFIICNKCPLQNVCRKIIYLFAHKI